MFLYSSLRLPFHYPLQLSHGSISRSWTLLYRSLPCVQLHLSQCRLVSKPVCLVLVCPALGKSFNHRLIGLLKLTSTTSTFRSPWTFLVGFLALSHVTVTLAARNVKRVPTNSSLFFFFYCPESKLQMRFPLMESFRLRPLLRTIFLQRSRRKRLPGQFLL